MSADRRPLRELGQFLRNRRLLVDPAAKGLPLGKRRTPGLRREEVAILASISPSWYTYLEQGRDIRPSESVLNALADVLDLTAAERRYVTLLSMGSAPHRDQPLTEEARTAITTFVESIDLPAFAGDMRGDIVAWNRACSEWLFDFGTLPEEERNSLLWTALHPAARERYVDWEQEVRSYFGRFRGATANLPDDPRIRAVVDRLEHGPADVREMWESREVSELTFGVRRLRHPELGVRSFTALILLVAGADTAGVVVHVPVSGIANES
ncbi:MAG TPA: helix-turn-helix transcriptional regulator [Actinospica sp.]|nr:helix-turn-helix transcriptional regulator [Actinospica sp.]